MVDWDRVGFGSISFLQVITRRNVLDKQYDELAEQQRKEKIRSEFINEYIYCPLGGPSGEIITGSIEDVVFDVIDDFRLKIELYYIDDKGNFAKDGYHYLEKELALKGFLFSSKEKLLEHINRKIRKQELEIGSFRLTYRGVLIHLLELHKEFFPEEAAYIDSRIAEFYKQLLEIIMKELEEEDDKQSNNKEIIFTTLTQLAIAILPPRGLDLPVLDRLSIMHFVISAFSLLLGSQYAQKSDEIQKFRQKF